MSTYESMTPAQLLARYNSHAEILGETLVKRFSDRKTAERRLAAIEDRFAQSTVGAPTATVTEPTTPATVAPLPAATVVEEQEPVKETKTKGTGRGRKTNLDLDLIYSPLMDPLSPTNPKRKGTRAYDIFEMYGTGIKGTQFVKKVMAAGYPRKLALDTLRWDLSHGLTVVGEKNAI